MKMAKFANEPEIINPYYINKKKSQRSDSRDPV